MAERITRTYSSMEDDFNKCAELRVELDEEKKKLEKSRKEYYDLNHEYAKEHVELIQLRHAVSQLHYDLFHANANLEIAEQEIARLNKDLDKCVKALDKSWTMRYGPDQ